MNTQKLPKRIAVSIGAATLALAVVACAHHSATVGDDYGQVRTDAVAQKDVTHDQVIGTMPAPSNTQNGTSSSTPAVIPGPAKVDNSGAAYTSSSSGGSGNGSLTGLNTNVNMIPQRNTSTVAVTESPAQVAEVTPPPAEAAPVYTAPPEPTTPVVTEPAPMASSSVDTTQTTETPAPAPEPTHHRRMRKD